MKRFFGFIKEDPLSLLLLALPITVLGQSLGWSSATIFALACIGIIPLASYIGKATEDLATHTGPQCIRNAPNHPKIHKGKPPGRLTVFILILERGNKQIAWMRVSVEKAIFKDLLEVGIQ